MQCQGDFHALYLWWEPLLWRRKPQEHYHRSRRRPLQDDPGFVLCCTVIMLGCLLKMHVSCQCCINVDAIVCFFLKHPKLFVVWQIMIHLIHLGVMHLHIGEVLNRRCGTPLPLTWFEIRWRQKGNMEGKVALNLSMSNTTAIHTSWDRGWIRNIPERW